MWRGMMKQTEARGIISCSEAFELLHSIHLSSVSQSCMHESTHHRKRRRKTGCGYLVSDPMRVPVSSSCFNENLFSLFFFYVIILVEIVLDIPFLDGFAQGFWPLQVENLPLKSHRCSPYTATRPNSVVPGEIGKHSQPET